MATLVLQSLTQAHSDSKNSNNPSLCVVNWRRSMRCVDVTAPKAQQFTLQPGATVQVLQTASWASPSDTVYSLKVNQGNTYRLTYESNQHPNFRTPRSVDLTGVEVVFEVQNNNVMALTATSGTPFADVQDSDEIFIPGMMTGDGSTPFSPLNQGRWVVLAAAPDALVLARPQSMDFQGIDQTVTATSPSEFLAFSASGVQSGDRMVLGSGFPSSVRGMYVLGEVTANWVEFKSSRPLPMLASVTPGTTGVTIIDNAIRYLRVESDQVVSVTTNGGDPVQLTPWESGNPELVSEYVLTGLVWSLSITNDSSTEGNVTVITAE